MERATEIFAALYFFGIGASHLLQPLVWVEFFADLRARGRSGVFFEGLMSLGFGGFVAAFHPVWTGLPIVLTLVGWGQLLKGLVRLLAPALSLRVYAGMTAERAWQFRVAGVFSLLLGAVFGYCAWLR